MGMTQKKISNEEAKQALLKLVKFAKQESIVGVNKSKSQAGKLVNRVKSELNNRGILFNHTKFIIDEFPVDKQDLLKQVLNHQKYNYEICFGTVAGTNTEVYFITNSKNASELFYNSNVNAYQDALKLDGMWFVADVDFTAIVPVGSVIKAETFQKKVLNQIDSRNGLFPMAVGEVSVEDTMFDQVVVTID